MTTEQPFDFRRMKWGMNHDDVLASEPGRPDLVMPGAIMYETELYALPMTLTFMFVEDGERLICGAAVVQVSFRARNFYVCLSADSGATSKADEAIKDYHQLRGILKQELGDPLEDDDAYRDEETLEALKNGSDLRSPTDDHPDESPWAELRSAEHTESMMLSLMRCSRWRSDRTDTSPASTGTSFPDIRITNYVFPTADSIVPSPPPAQRNSGEREG